MCRIALTVNTKKSVAKRASELLSNGADGHLEIWGCRSTHLVHNRFDVTSSGLPKSTFPLEGERYVVSLNGEVYEFRGELFSSQSQYESDIHFASHHIHQSGLEEFLREVDFQGTILVYDKKTDCSFLVVDQLNTAGCFYSHFNGCFIAASEHAVVNALLGEMKAPKSIPINIVPNGSYLKIESSSDFKAVVYRDSFQSVWSSQDTFSTEHFQHCVERFDRALSEAIAARIPQDGPVIVLAGGGVDSGVVVGKVARNLEANKELDRLKVVALGDSRLLADSERNDFLNVEKLIKHLGIDQKHILQICPAEINELRESLYRNCVFSDQPRLIPPDPSRTQIRHTVTMSCVLGKIVQMLPGVRCVISGDGADELLAGYNSMIQDVGDGGELRARIVQKLHDFPLNDASRVSLASYHGAWESSRIAVGDDLASPMEVRMPFTCHHVLNAVRETHPDYLVGGIDGEIYSKLILRIVALNAGLAPEVCIRTKMPFHEGATGTRNSDTDRLEIDIVKDLYTYRRLKEEVGNESNLKALRRLGIYKGNLTTKSQLRANRDRIAMFIASKRTGLERMLIGNVFSEEMPDAIYSTDMTGNEYMPLRYMNYSSTDKSVRINSQSS